LRVGRGLENNSSPREARRGRSRATNDASSVSGKKHVSHRGRGRSVAPPPFANPSRRGRSLLQRRDDRVPLPADNARKTARRTQTCPADSPTTASSRSKCYAGRTTSRCERARSIPTWRQLGISITNCQFLIPGNRSSLSDYQPFI